MFPLGNLRAGEFVLFISHISTGLGLTISSFFLLLLEDFGLQLQHLTPHSILLMAIFVDLCEMFVGVRPCVLFPNEKRSAVSIHPRAQWREVG